jgi:hypothetical protein
VIIKLTRNVSRPHSAALLQQESADCQQEC